MAYDDEDLFEEEFDFVDEDDESDVEEEEVDAADADAEEEKPLKPKRRSSRSTSSQGGAKRDDKKRAAEASEEDDEFAPEVEGPEEAAEPAGPPADHVVHIYEFGKFKRTIQREFTDEDAIKFAEEFNRTSKTYGRHAVPVERDEEPEPHL